MKIRAHHLIVALLVAPVVALVVAWIGFFNIGASSGHWKITEWFLELAMRSAIRTYALNVEPPEELPHDAFRPAAAHFAQGCAFCHGEPGQLRDPVVMAMLPQPPNLAVGVQTWTDAQLFRIVKHGIRFTGMPAWPTQERDDEVWMMVAFLRALPDLAPADYADVAIDATAPEPLVRCAACHGVDGREGGIHVPILAGQNQAYLDAALLAYANRDRASGIMQLAASELSADERAALARHFAEQPGISAIPKGAPPALVTEGRPRHGIPACISCHAGNRDPGFPVLGGQRAEYLAAQLRLFREGTRGGTGHAEVMTEVARNLEDADIEELAAYFAGQPAAANEGQ